MADENNQDKANEEQKKTAEEKVPFEKKWLKDLTFTGTRIKKTKGEDGEVNEKRVVMERPLTEADLLAWRVDGDQVVMVTADGRKYRVKK